MSGTNDTILVKPRYEILDGLRGVAAILVVIYHLFESHFGLGAAHPLNHGYLAVDFFFVLSGFVIGYAYDDRWDKMSIGTFFKRRFVRLHPMVVCGSFIGLITLHFQQCEVTPNIANATWWALLLCFLWSITMIPVHKSLDVRGWSETNPLNSPTWSLFWEYIANILYALFFRRMSKVVLSLFVVLFACLTVILCFNIDIFGTLSTRSESMIYSVIGGWSITPEHIQVGLSRLLYPFFMGLLMSRLKWNIQLKGGFWWCTLLIFAMMVVPRLGGDEGVDMWMNGMYNALVILFVLPLIVAIGAGSTVQGRRMTAVNKFLGDISYPLYITHYGFINMQVKYVVEHPEASTQTHVFIGISVFVISILTAYATMKLYDLPIREWLAKKMFAKRV